MSKLAILGGNPVIDNQLELYRSIGKEEEIAVNKVMKSGNLSQFIGAMCGDFYGGPKVKEFEKLWSESFNIKHSISVNSNTSGLIAAMGAIGLSPGDEVILPPWTMSATAMAPLFYGGIPIFADIESKYYCLSYDSVKAKITNKTKAIIAVNLFGHPAELHQLRRLADINNIFLIEDNAQAIYAKENNEYTGTIGHIGIFSLNYHKHINTGEGGMCTTNDDLLALKMQMIRNHGENAVESFNLKSDLPNLIGQNYRLTEIQAAIGIEQIKKAKDLIERRKYLANKLSESLNGIEGITPPQLRDNCENVFYEWVGNINEDVLGINRSIFLRALVAEGAPFGGGYVEPLYMLPVFQSRIALGKKGFPFNLSDVDYSKISCPNVESLHKKSMIEFYICSYQLDGEDLDKIIESIHKIFENLDQLRKIDQGIE